MTGGATGFPVKNGFATQFAGPGLGGIKLAVDVQFGRRREIEQRQELRHKMDLRASFKNIDPLLGSHAMIAVEVCGALFELGEILHRLQGSLRAEQTLNTYSPQGRCIDPVPELLRSYVPDQRIGSIGDPVGMTIKTGNAQTGSVSPP